MNVNRIFSEEASIFSNLMTIVVGIVSDNRDPERLGRVKVTFSTRGIPDQSHWARIATLMAGPNRGSFFLPEVGDEVLVAFDHGDLRQPYVIGALWNGKDLPPENNSDGLNSIRKITSRSGHELIFDDGLLGGGVEVCTHSGHKIKLHAAGGDDYIEIRDANRQNNIIIDATRGSITIESSMKLSLKATDIDIEAAANLNLRAGATLDMKATMVTIN